MLSTSSPPKPYVCTVVTQSLYSVDLGHYTTYGILIRQSNAEETLFSDLSLNQEAVQRLAQLLNTHLPNMVHLPEILDDFLADEDAFPDFINP